MITLMNGCSAWPNLEVCARGANQIAVRAERYRKLALGNTNTHLFEKGAGEDDDKTDQIHTYFERHHRR